MHFDDRLVQIVVGLRLTCIYIQCRRVTAKELLMIALLEYYGESLFFKIIEWSDVCGRKLWLLKLAPIADVRDFSVIAVTG